MSFAGSSARASRAHRQEVRYACGMAFIRRAVCASFAMFSVASMLCRCTTFGTGEEGTPSADAANGTPSPSVLPDGALVPPGVDAGSDRVAPPSVHYAGSPTNIELTPSRMHAAVPGNGAVPRFFRKVEQGGKAVAVEVGGTKRWPLEHPNNGFAMLTNVSNHMDVLDNLVGVGIGEADLKVGEGRGGSTVNATAVATAGGLIYIAHEKGDGVPVISEIPVAQSNLDFGTATMALRLRDSFKTPFVVSSNRLSLIRLPRALPTSSCMAAPALPRNSRQDPSREKSSLRSLVSSCFLLRMATFTPRMAAPIRRSSSTMCERASPTRSRHSMWGDAFS